ncbi:hypothetical protein KCU73_g981, partial [Aureobasidium melanogenum]
MYYLRVGYVNVRGLTTGKWNRLVELLDSGDYDLLFAAETWYVSYDVCSVNRYFIASTTQSREARDASSKGRASGGMYLFGTAEAIGRVHGVTVCQTICESVLGRVNRAKGYTYEKRKKKKKQTDSVISSAGDCGTDGKDVNNNDDAAAAAVLTAPAAATAVLAVPSLSSSPVTSAPTETRRNTSPADD